MLVSYFFWLTIKNPRNLVSLEIPCFPFVFISYLPFCQAKPKLEAEMAVFSIVNTIYPPIRTSLNLASDNITAKSKVAYLSELGQ